MSLDLEPESAFEPTFALGDRPNDRLAVPPGVVTVQVPRSRANLLLFSYIDTKGYKNSVDKRLYFLKFRTAISRSVSGINWERNDPHESNKPGHGRPHSVGFGFAASVL